MEDKKGHLYVTPQRLDYTIQGKVSYDIDGNEIEEVKCKRLRVSDIDLRGNFVNDESAGLIAQQLGGNVRT